MKKKVPPYPIKNPIAKDLRTPKFRKRVTKDKTKYNRKKKDREEDL